MSYQESLSTFKTVDLDQMRKAGFLEEMLELHRKSFDKINQKSGFRERRQCPVCSSTSSTKEFSKFGMDIVRCNECSARFVTRIPADMDDICSDAEQLPLSIYMERSSYRKERFGRERIKLILDYVNGNKPGRLLDIGCGTGWFLDVAKEYGFEVYGQELGKELAHWTAKQLGIEVFNQPVRGLPESMKFDVITMFDVLEHIPDPLELLLDCKDRLNNNGIIVIFAFNFDSLSIGVAREHSNLVCPTEHLTYFTEKSIRVLSERVGLELVYFKTCGIDLGDLKSYFEWKGRNDISLACKELYDIIQPVVDQAGAGNHLRSILKKEPN